MLEAIRERQQSWIAKLILALIAVPFALWGVDSYLRQAGSNVAVAKVNGDPITMQQFAKSLEELRDTMKGKADAGYLENPEVRNAVLDKLINAHLLADEVKHGSYVISDEQLSKFIIAMPEFQKDGQFSQDMYDKVLADNNLTPSRFESRMRGELLKQQIRDSISGLAFVPRVVPENAMRVQHQLREVSVASFRPDDYLDQAKVDPAELKTYYDKHQEEFRIPEQVKLEFVVLSASSMVTSMNVADEEVKKFYEENASLFQGDEERRASHILIAFGANKDAAAKAAAKKKVEEVLAEVKKSPKKFEELAKKYSQDPGSAEKGGDLGPIKRGLMVKGGKYLEALAKADVLLIDKTGTLTLGKPVLTDILLAEPALLPQPAGASPGEPPAHRLEERLHHDRRRRGVKDRLAGHRELRCPPDSNAP